ncbi:MAG: hypothetical protein HUJ18_07610 [Marinobacter sp.]|nr:hypothetical protein [Marinobacter sp.]
MVSIRKLAACTILAAAPVWAFAHGEQGSWQGHGPGMMMDQDQMQQMQQNWSRMNEFNRRMPGAGSPEERQRLLEDHWEAMEEQMELMHRGMMGPGMMGGSGGMMGGNQGQGMMNNQPGQGNRQGNGAGMSPDQRLQFMEQRMDQMQLMMEQMLQHQRQLNRN